MLINANMMAWIASTINLAVLEASESHGSQFITVSKTPAGGLQLTITPGWGSMANHVTVDAYAANNEATGTLCARLALAVANILATEAYAVKELNEHERDLVNSQKIIEAIKALRERGGLTLKDAKSIVDRYRAEAS